MSLRIFKNQDYEFTHENEQFRELVSILKKKFDSTDDLNLLFANIYFGGVPLDALFVKRNAIIVFVKTFSSSSSSSSEEPPPVRCYGENIRHLFNTFLISATKINFLNKKIYNITMTTFCFYEHQQSDFS